MTPSEHVQIPGIAALIGAFQEPTAEAFTRALVAWDPADAFDDFDLPVLLVQGHKDLQVRPDLDTDLLEAAARDAGRTVIRVDLPDADHVLKHEPAPFDTLTAAAGLSYNAPGRDLAVGLVDAIAAFTRAPR